jgi:hypothetical protein
MKVSRYAVSVQWGAGHHYFEKYFNTKPEATAYAENWKHKIVKRLKPTVHLWYLLDSFKKE